MCNKPILIQTTTIVLMWIGISDAQTDAAERNSFRVELGPGLCKASTVAGFSGRLAMMGLFPKWGGIIRVTAHSGERGQPVQGFFRTYDPKEKFYDSAILFSRVLVHHNSIKIISSAGLGTFWGERLNEDKTDLIEFNRVQGFAYELSFSTSGSIIGITLSLLGNVNAESNLYGITVCFTIGSR